MKTRRLYLIAGILSFVFYISGILTSYYFLPKDGIDFLESSITAVEEQLKDIQEEYLLLSFRGPESCGILSTLSGDVATRLDAISRELVSLERSNQRGRDFENLKSNYASLAVRAWVLNSNIKEACKADVVSALYFYSYPCDDCKRQEQVLELLKEKYGRERLIAYAIDFQVTKSSTQVIVKTFGIKDVPSILIGDTVYRGLTNETVLEKAICSQLSNATCTNL